jgi:biotin operon repressor
MSPKRVQLKDWERLIEAEDPTVQDFASGPSPGGAAAELGISRQAIHHAIRAGKLKVLAVYDGRRLSHYTISRSSLAQYQQELRERTKVQLQRLAARL